MAYGLVIGDDARVAAWAVATFKLFPTRFDKVLGIINPGEGLVGAALFHYFNSVNVEMSYYGKRTLTLGIVRVISRFVLSEFNCARGTVITSKKNKRLMRSLQKLGFKLEGTQRRYYGERDCSRNTGVRFVIFREQIEQLAKLPVQLLKQEQG